MSVTEMNIKLITGRHLTATNKRHIAQMIEQGLTVGSTKTISYEFHSVTDKTIELTVAKTESNDWGKKVYRDMKCVVEYA